MQTAKYDPSVFDVKSMADARQIVLTPEGGLTTDQRWQREAPHILDLLAPLNLHPDSVVMDYGCGLGRIAKLIIEKYQCRVVGVDISANMRALSAAYVNSSMYFTVHPDALSYLTVPCKMEFSAALAIWVLQHCFDPAEDIRMIKSSLRSDGRLFVINNDKRAVPARINDTNELGWVDDSKSIESLLKEKFTEVEKGRMDPNIVSEFVADRTFWAVYQCQ